MPNKERKVALSQNWLLRRKSHSFDLYSIHGERISVSSSRDLLAFKIIEFIGKNPQTISSIFAYIKERDACQKPIFTNKLQSLIKSGIVTIETDEGESGLSKSELQRYKWQLEYLSSYQSLSITKYDLQKNWKNSKIAIIGLGGQGTIVSQLLSAIGIGQITGVDGDRVESSNLTRQLIYKEKDIGANKVDVMERELTTQNSNLNYIGIRKYITTLSGMRKVFRGQDLVILCADKPLVAIRDLTNTVAIETRTPYIAVSGSWVGPLCVPFKTACFECEKAHYRKKYTNYDEFMEMLKQVKEMPRPSFSFRPIVSGSLIAMQAAKFLSKTMPVEVLKGKYKLDMNMDFHFEKMVRNKKCNICNDKLKG